MSRALWVLVLAGALVACGDKGKPAGGEGGGIKESDEMKPEAEAAPAEPAGKAKASARLDHPGTADGAEALLARFVAEGADHAALSAALRPEKADYDAVFVQGASPKAMAAYGPAWEAGQLVVRPKPGQTEVLLFEATTDQIKAGDPAAKDFPGGYAQVADQLAPGVTVYRFKFVEPGKDVGMAFDGLVHVNGRWAIFPKPWRALR